MKESFSIGFSSYVNKVKTVTFRFLNLYLSMLFHGSIIYILIETISIYIVDKYCVLFNTYDRRKDVRCLLISLIRTTFIMSAA